MVITPKASTSKPEVCIRTHTLVCRYLIESTGLAAKGRPLEPAARRYLYNTGDVCVVLPDPRLLYSQEQPNQKQDTVLFFMRSEYSTSRVNPQPEAC